MKKCIVIIDLHCDPTIPSGAGDIGGGNTYSRSLLHALQTEEIFHIYITRKKYPYLEEYIHMTPFSDFYRIDLGDWGPVDKDVLQNYHEISKEQILKILTKYKDYNFIFHSSYWQSGMLAYEIAPIFNTFYVHTILSNAKKKSVVGATDDIAEQRIKEEEKIFAYAKYLICSSLSEIKEMQELYSIPSEKLLLAGLEVDHHYLYPAYNPRGEVRINTLGHTGIIEQYLSYSSLVSEVNDGLWWNQKNFIYFGRIHKNKGIKEIIIAWKVAFDILGDDTPNLWIVGGAPSQIESFRNSIIHEVPWLVDCEKKHKIVWWGALPPEGISTLLLKSSVLITHSKYEAGGPGLLEALSQGVPVIATPNGYGKDYLIDWYNGFTVDYQDIDTLTQKMLYFCGQPFLCDYMGQNAKDSSIKINQSFDFSYMHKFSYGLVSNEKKQDYIVSKIDWYNAIKYHSMDTYPYLTECPTTQGISYIVQNYTNSAVYEVTDISDLVPDFKLWEVATSNGTYVFAYYYDIINTTNIWNPFSKENYVITKSQRVLAITDIFEKAPETPLIYNSTSHGYVLFQGDVASVFSEEKYIKLIEEVSIEEEQDVLHAKYIELIQVLNSQIYKRYNVKPVAHYLSYVSQTFFASSISMECTIPFASIYTLYFKTCQDANALLFDKIGLQYKYLKICSHKISNAFEILNKEKISLDILWSIYFECYKYAEQILIYSDDSKNSFIEALYNL